MEKFSEEEEKSVQPGELSTPTTYRDMPTDLLTKPITHRELYPDLRQSYELCMKILFEANRQTGKLSPDVVNPLLKKFKEKVETFRFQEGTLNVFALTVDEFRWEELRDRTIFSYSVKWRVNDSGPGATDRFNNFIRPALSTAVRRLEVKEGGITVKVINTMYAGDVMEGRWPREEF